MKKTLLIGLCVTLILIFILNISIPNDQKYIDWLLSEHGISCTSTNIMNDCTLMNENKPIDWKSRHVRNTGIYITTRDNFKDQEGNLYVVKSIGIMLKFYRR